MSKSIRERSILIFDLDGTIINSGEGITKSAQYALSQYGITINDLSDLIPFIGPPLSDTLENDYGFDPATALEAVTKYREFYVKEGINQYFLYEGMKELIKDLAAAGKTLLLATTKPEKFAVKILERENLAKYFKYIGGANLDGSRSGKPELLEYVLENIGGASTEDAVMIGDKSHDIKGAQFHNMPVVAVSYGFGIGKELENAKPTIIVDSVQELRELFL